MQKEDKNYYISLTREIKNDKTLPSLAKLLYGDICTLAKKHGVCFATNEYFAKEYGVSRRTISRNVKALQERGLIKVEIKINEYGCRLRYITPLQKMESADMVEPTKPKKKDYSYLD